LGVDHVLIYIVGIGKGVLDVTAGDGVEDDALRDRGLDAEDMGEMPGDGLSFPVEVGCEPDIDGVLGGFLEIGDNGLFSGEDFVGGFEVVFEINSRNGLFAAFGGLGGEVADVADGGLDDIIRAEVFVYGFGFGGGFDDDEVLALGGGGFGPSGGGFLPGGLLAGGFFLRCFLFGCHGLVGRIGQVGGRSEVGDR